MMLKRSIFLCLTFSGVLGLQGCASLDKQQCQSGNWYAIGHKDGQVGHTSERYREHISACKQHGLATNQAEYFRGRADGLKRYCTPLGGLRSGELGINYKGTCPSDTLYEFRQGFDLGRDIYFVERELEQVRYEIHESRIRRLDRASRDRGRGHGNHHRNHHYHHGSHEHYLRQRELRYELRLRELRARANELILEHRKQTDLAPL